MREEENMQAPTLAGLHEVAGLDGINDARDG